MPLPIQFLLFLLIGWVSRQQEEAIEYLRAENKALLEQLGGKRLRFATLVAAPVVMVAPMAVRVAKGGPASDRCQRIPRGDLPGAGKLDAQSLSAPGLLQASPEGHAFRRV